MQYSGSLFIIAAASGTGKTSLAKALAESLTDIKISISHTTRPQRSGEQEGRDYFFVEENIFQSMIAEKAFLEYAKVFDHYYGTSKQWVLNELEKGQDIILDIDWQGAKQVRQAFADYTVSIFLLPPSQKALQERLEARKRDSEEIIAHRLAKASQEISHYAEFDYLVINDDFAKAVADLQYIVRATRLKQCRQAIKQKRLLADLLEKQ